MGEWEACLHWPGTLRQVRYVMIPKPEAINESQLMPTGLLPHILWGMAGDAEIARPRLVTCAAWGNHLGAATLASRTRASVEVQKYMGRWTLLTFMQRDAGKGCAHRFRSVHTRATAIYGRGSRGVSGRMRAREGDPESLHATGAAARRCRRHI